MAIKKNDPMKTRTGKDRLGPLSVAQLTAALENTNSAKQKAKIRQALAVRTSTQMKPSETSNNTKKRLAKLQAEAPAAETQPEAA